MSEYGKWQMKIINFCLLSVKEDQQRQKKKQEKTSELFSGPLPS